MPPARLSKHQSQSPSPSPPTPAAPPLIKVVVVGDEGAGGGAARDHVHHGRLHLWMADQAGTAGVRHGPQPKRSGMSRRAAAEISGETRAHPKPCCLAHLQEAAVVQEAAHTRDDLGAGAEDVLLGWEGRSGRQ